MANLRKEARGRECQVRIYGVCNGNPETTVLAHYRMAGICGTGMKPDDLIGAWACSACHDEIDRRTHNLDNKDARWAITIIMGEDKWQNTDSHFRTHRR